MTIKKAALKRAGFILSGLLLISLFVLVAGPVMFVDAAVDACGDGVCDASSENNDLCPEDCQCIDNGVKDPSEGCGCKDVICEGEGAASACGTNVGVNGECPGNLVNAGGICWDRCECQGICSEDDTPACTPWGGCLPPGGTVAQCCNPTQSMLIESMACPPGWVMCVKWEAP